MSRLKWVARPPDRHPRHRLPHRRRPAGGGPVLARWSQEKFFKYARQHYGLDRLADYSIEDIPDTLKVVNPAHRCLDGQVRSATGKLNRLLARFGTQSKHLVDTLKMIACRAETAMANSLLQALYQIEADLLPDHEAGTLTIRLHHSANASTDAAIQKLCDELNETETLFPRTNLRLILKVGYL